MTYESLLYEVDDRVATLTLNRPERMNALSQKLVNEIIAAVASADHDPEVRVLLIKGAGGKAFSSGYDIKESAEQPKRGLVEWRARMQKDLRFTYSVWDCSKPVIAVIDGFCLAGALEFAMSCDIRYASDDAKFGAVEARFSNGIATMIMPWLIGQRARALIYTGDIFDAAEAYRLGLVDKVFPKAALAHGDAQDRTADVARVARLPQVEQARHQPDLRDHGPQDRHPIRLRGLGHHGRRGLARSRHLRLDPPHEGPRGRARVARRAIRTL